MKNALLKITTGLMFACFFMTTFAQVAPTAPANPAQEKASQEQKKASAIVNNIATSVNISEEQKTQLSASLLTCFKKFDDARATLRNDENKLMALRSELQESLIASIKSVLTPEQYKTAMEKANNK